MKKGVAVNRLRTVKLKNEFCVRPLSGCSFWLCLLGLSVSKLTGRPQLAFIFAEILNDKRADMRNRKESFASRINRKASEIAGYPTPLQFFSYGGSGPASTKDIEN